MMQAWVNRLVMMLAVLAGTWAGGCTSQRGPVAAEPPTSAVAPVAPRAATASRNAYVLLSGGGTPLTNNYSQYLQARAVADFFVRECPPETTWVFFGAGNRAGATPIVADVRRQQKTDGLLVESWLPGVLPNNRPATRASFLRTLREEILPVVRGGGTLFLFVGDHGEVAGPEAQRESAIVLWQMRQDRRTGALDTVDDEVLGVAELRRVLAEGLGNGRVLFCMTQCHSGGFHGLGVPAEPAVPASWFTARPRGLDLRSRAVSPRIAGFTATDMASPAAGCEPNPDPEQWAGYERFMPEKLLGVDLMTGRSVAAGVRSLAEAHEAATLVDHTIDKPRSTAEHTLAQWATLIESKIGTSPQLTARAKAAVEAYRQCVTTGELTTQDAPLLARRAQYGRFVEALVTQLPTEAELLRHGTRDQLDRATRRRGERGGERGPRRGLMAELRRAWKGSLRPAWKAAVLQGEVPALQGAALTFERELLKREDRGTELLLPRGGDDTELLNALYTTAGYDNPAHLDPAGAAPMARWAAARRTEIVRWVARSPDAAVRAAAERIGPGPQLVEEPPPTISRRTAAERVLFYRRVLGAWQFLLAMEARDALADVHALLEIERTPLRR